MPAKSPQLGTNLSRLRPSEKCRNERCQVGKKGGERGDENVHERAPLLSPPRRGLPLTAKGGGTSLKRSPFPIQTRPPSYGRTRCELEDSMLVNL